MTPGTEPYKEIRDAIRDLCAGFPAAYFREIDEKRGYPDAFVDALTRAGWLAALIPQEYGGSGLGLAEASVIMEEINRCGGNSGACHGQMYNMGTLLRHGSDTQKRQYLPKIASGELRLQSMGVTEPTTGSDTTKIRTVAMRRGERYVVNGQKVWISRVLHSDLMILLARTTPIDEVKKRSEGMSIFVVDLRDAVGHGLTVRPIANMVNHETNELFFDNLEHAGTNVREPCNSTTQIRQTLTGVRFSRKHRVGVSMPRWRQASSNVVPSGTDIFCSSIISSTRRREGSVGSWGIGPRGTGVNDGPTKTGVSARVVSSFETPLLGGECSFEKAARFSLQGWVPPVGTTHPYTPPAEGTHVHRTWRRKAA